MGRSSRSRFLIAATALVAVIAGAAALISSGSSNAREARTASPPRVTVPAGATVINVGGAARARAIGAGFVGLSLEYQAIEPYAGSDAGAVNPVLVQLIRNLSPGGSPSLRIGGDSTDWAWWPVAGMARPPGVTITLDHRWLQVTSALTRALGARLILGIDLEAGSRPVAVAEARALVAGVGSGSVRALELGNEPELYASFKWGPSKFPGRAPGYDFPAFIRDVARIGGALPPLPLAGPTTGAPKWMAHTGQFLAAEPRVGLVTLHRYPLQQCFIKRASPQYPTIAHMLAGTASTGLANSVTRYAAISHAHGLPLRIDEMNTVSCGGARGVSDAFASALWALDALFEMARVGVDGVNIHTYPGSTYELFSVTHVHGKWRATVAPEYYGLMTFAQAAPPGSHLLRLSERGARAVKAWATRAPDGRTRVVLINDSPTRASFVVVKARGGPATLERLQAPSLTATHGVTLGGQSFGSASATGLLAGRPRTVTVAPAAGQYVVKVPAGSAALLTLMLTTS